MKGKGCTQETLRQMYYEDATAPSPQILKTMKHDVYEENDQFISGRTIMGFGRYSKLTYLDVAMRHPGYVNWAMKQQDVCPQLLAFQHYIVMRDNVVVQQKVQV